MPRPALKVKYRSPASPSPIVRYRPAAMTSLIRPIAAAASAGSPSARANTLAPAARNDRDSGGPAAGRARGVRLLAHDPVDRPR